MSPIQQMLLGTGGAASINDFQFTLQNNGFHQAEANENTIHSRFNSAGVTTTSSGSSYTLTANAAQHLASVEYMNGWNVITTRSDRQGKIKIRVKGASGGTTNGAGGGASIKGYRNWGRDIEATFTWSGQKKFLIGLGSVGQTVGWQYNSNSSGGASGGGGCTCFVYQSGSNYYPIMIGAGGGGATNDTTVIAHYKAQSSSARERHMGGAVPLSGPSTGSAVHTVYDWRNYEQGNSFGVNHRKGIGRTSNGTGGGGWEDLGYPTTHQGGQSQAFFSYYYFVKPGYNTGIDDTNTSDNTSSTYIGGGWGVGGAGYLGSFYPPGGGGFFGGYEQDYAEYSTTTYEPKYSGGSVSGGENNLGAISFCSPTGGADTRGDEDGTKQTDIAYINNSFTDNGWHHTENDGSDAWKLYGNSNTADAEANGQAIIEFKDVEAI